MEELIFELRKSGKPVGVLLEQRGWRVSGLFRNSRFEDSLVDDLFNATRLRFLLVYDSLLDKLFNGLFGNLDDGIWLASEKRY